MNNVPEFVDIELTSEYGYSFNELKNQMEASILHMQALFQASDFLHSELELIGKEFVVTAQKFAREQGLGGGTSLLGWGKTPKNRFGTVTGPTNLNGIATAKGPTGNLISHIKYNISDNNNIMFYNDAQNSRGQYYAGHIEYGFHDRGGGMVPARPFMRPALYAVADASRGKISGTLKRYLEEMWAMESLKFGYPITPHGNYRRFYDLHERQFAKGYGRYTASLLPKGRLQQMRSLEGRQKFTVDRKGSKPYREYTQRISQRMGSKAGWIKNSKGQTVYKRDTRWTSTANRPSSTKSTSNTIKSSTSQKNRQRGASRGTNNVVNNFENRERQSYSSFLGSTNYHEKGSTAAHGEGIERLDGSRYGRNRK